MIDYIIIIIIHWIADFIFQDEEWANNKSTNNTALLKHTIIYSLLWFIPIIFLMDDNLSSKEYFIGGSLFVIITFIFHTLTDYFTSKIVSKQFKKGYFGSKIPNFGAFTTIGFDQVLHYMQLFLTYKLLFE